MNLRHDIGDEPANCPVQRLLLPLTPLLCLNPKIGLLPCLPGAMCIIIKVNEYLWWPSRPSSCCCSTPN